MKNQNPLLHTPEGVRDIYGNEFVQKFELQQLLYRVLAGRGYQGIETPTFEFFDVFSREVGTVPSRELYKFFDKEGNTLVLRPDMTPSIARAVSKYFHDETPIRLCYMGNTFINYDKYQGRLKETTQMGAELMGDGLSLIHIYEEENTYELLGSVFQQDEPDVYYQNLAGDEDEKEIDEAVLKDWLDFCIGDAGQLEIPMVDLTEENIKALK